jgi:cytochrome c-type biogenesis protein
LLAAQGQNLGQVAITMVSFGLGVAVPLVIIGMMSREVLMRWRGRMLSSGGVVKSMLGVLLVFTGVMIVTGQDKILEAALVDASPDWLTTLTTRF